MKKIGIKQILLLQAIIVIYTVSGIMAKFASAGETLEKIILFLGLDLLLLGVYAILWQQILKKIDLSIAYSNKAVLTIWGVVWSVLLFKEIITVKTIISAILLIIGILFINKKEGDKK